MWCPARASRVAVDSPSSWLGLTLSGGRSLGSRVSGELIRSLKTRQHPPPAEEPPSVCRTDVGLGQQGGDGLCLVLASVELPSRRRGRPRRSSLSPGPPRRCTSYCPLSRCCCSLPRPPWCCSRSRRTRIPPTRPRRCGRDADPSSPPHTQERRWALLPHTRVRVRPEGPLERERAAPVVGGRHHRTRRRRTHPTAAPPEPPGRSATAGPRQVTDRTCTFGLKGSDTLPVLALRSGLAGNCAHHRASGVPRHSLRPAPA